MREQGETLLPYEYVTAGTVGPSAAVKEVGEEGRSQLEGDRRDAQNLGSPGYGNRADNIVVPLRPESVDQLETRDR